MKDCGSLVYFEISEISTVIISGIMTTEDASIY